MHCSGCFIDIADGELHVDDWGLVQYHFACFNRLVVSVIIGIITFQRKALSCNSAQKSVNSSALGVHND